MRAYEYGKDEFKIQLDTLEAINIMVALNEYVQNHKKDGSGIWEHANELCSKLDGLTYGAVWGDD